MENSSDLKPKINTTIRKMSHLRNAKKVIGDYSNDDVTILIDALLKKWIRNR